jgi:AraC family transcriptional regulator
LPVEVSSDEIDDFHTLTVPLRPTRMEFTVGQKLVFRGLRQVGTVFLTGPKTQRWGGVFFEGFDHLRCYIPQTIMADCYEFSHGQSPSSEIVLLESCDADDVVLTHLARMLSALGNYGNVYDPCFIDSLGLLIASRLLSLYHGPRSKPEARKPLPLIKWRLDKALEYIDSHLTRPIYLSELCETVGLSRMHFAAQFRAATGYAPYAYILRQRISRAQRLLRDPSQTIVDVALRVGFSSQPHFTDAFRRAIGETPSRWRKKVLS